MRAFPAAVFAPLLLILGAQVSAAAADSRIALLIANRAYAPEIGPLKNPHNDIRLLGAALAQVGFVIGTPVKDASREQILLAVHDFADHLMRAGPGAIGFLYYSGHGIAAGSDNVLLPVGIRSTAEREVEIFGVKLTDIVDLLNDKAPQAVHFIVVDACRSSLGGARGSRGFVPIAERPGMVISLSTAPGATASDEGQDSGPYAAALAAEIVVPWQNHGQMFFAVRRRVAFATQQQQVPWTRDGLLRRVFFAGKGQGGPGPAPSEVSPSPQGAAAQAWLLASESKDRMVLEAFIARYGDTFYAELARARLRQLEQEKPVPAVSAPPPPPPKPPAPTRRPSDVPKRAAVPKPAATGNCRKETRDECIHRTKFTGIPGSRRRYSGACSPENRIMVCR
jgi:uncharacterized caspase-like protein